MISLFILLSSIFWIFKINYTAKKIDIILKGIENYFNTYIYDTPHSWEDFNEEIKIFKRIVGIIKIFVSDWKSDFSAYLQKDDLDKILPFMEKSKYSPLEYIKDSYIVFIQKIKKRFFNKEK